MKNSKKISILIKKSFYKDFEKVPKNHQKQIIQKIETLKENPLIGKPLKGDLGHIRRLRIGQYRLGYVFEKEKLIIVILKIGPRGDFYDSIKNLFL